jgi:predicted O-methyltransferase YrrM
VSIDGTRSYDGLTGLPALVDDCLDLARRLDFGMSCLPEHGRLIQLLAGGVAGGVIGETGTGCGVGLAWMASGASPDTQLVSIERDAALAAAVREVFAGVDNVTVLTGEWSELVAHSPFDLLVLDGGGQGKNGGDAFGPEAWLRPGATFVIDDLTPMTTWPPVWQGVPDVARLLWLENDDVLATEVRIRPDASSLVGLWHGGLPRSEVPG